jgi:hypothetical protein
MEKVLITIVGIVGLLFSLMDSMMSYSDTAPLVDNSIGVEIIL